MTKKDQRRQRTQSYMDLELNKEVCFGKLSRYYLLRLKIAVGQDQSVFSNTYIFLKHLYRAIFAVHGFVNRVHVSGPKFEGKEAQWQQSSTSSSAAGGVGQILIGHCSVACQQLHHRPQAQVGKALQRLHVQEQQ